MMKKLNKLKNTLSALIIFSLLGSCGIRNEAQSEYQGESEDGQREANRVEEEDSFALILSPTEDKLYMFDLATNRNFTAINTGRFPVDLAVSPNRKHIFVANKVDGTISTYFREDNRVIQLSGFSGLADNPTDLVLNKSGTELFVTYEESARVYLFKVLNRARSDLSNSFSIKDNQENEIIKPYQIITSEDENANQVYVISRQNSKLYVFNRDNEGNYSQGEIIQIAEENEKLFFSDIKIYKNKLYIADKNNDQIITFDLENKIRQNNIDLKSENIKGDITPIKIKISLDTKKMYTVNESSSTIGVINLENNQLIKHISLEEGNSRSSFPTDLSIGFKGELIYVTNSSGLSISIISGKDDKLLRNIGATQSIGFVKPLSAIKIL